MAKTPASATTLITPIPVLIGAGIRGVLHFFKGPNASDLDNTVNHLKGYIIEDFTKSGESIEQIEVREAVTVDRTLTLSINEIIRGVDFWINPTKIKVI